MNKFGKTLAGGVLATLMSAMHKADIPVMARLPVVAEVLTFMCGIDCPRACSHYFEKYGMIQRWNLLNRNSK